MKNASPAPPSVTERVAQTLLAFDGPGTWFGVSEIGRRVGVSKSVAHRILQTLVETGLVTHDPRTRQYALGPSAVALGTRAAAQDDLRVAGMPAISALAETTGETTTLSARIGYRRCYVGQVESARPIRITITIGQHVPLAVGASGLCILALLPPEDVDHALASPVPKLTERTSVETDVIRARLARFREQGWASTESEHVPLSRGIAAPVVDAQGAPVGSVSIAFLASRLAGRSLEEYARQAVATAADASRAYQARLHPRASRPAPTTRPASHL